jgi:replicative DNA helicase
MLDNVGGRVEKTHISNFDYATGGLEKQTLSIIGARPSMGKTSLGSQIAQENAKHGRKVIYFSLEMSKMSLWARMACGKLVPPVPWRDVLAKRVSPETIERIKEKSRELALEYGEYLLIDDKANMTSEDIYRKVSNIGPDLIVVDHLDLVGRSNRGREQEVTRLGNISRYGKIIAKEFDIPTIYLMQLNRQTEAVGRANKRPSMGDIRGSGEIEQDADNVFFLYRKDYYEESTTAPPLVSETEIIVAKFRNGIRNIQIKEMYHLDEQWFYPQKKAQGENGDTR